MTCWLCGFETTKLVTNAKAPICKNGPCQICTAVGKVDEEINQAVAALQRLLAKRCDLRSEQNRVHGTLIHRLPVELKNYIFELFQPLRDEWGKIRDIGGPVMPLYLTSICRSWRDIAWSIPSLWSAMHLTLGLKTRSRGRINVVHDWILRSRPMPLTFYIFDHNEMEDEEKTGVIDAGSQCSDRWHSLSLDMPLGLIRAFLHNNPQCHLLKRLKLLAEEDINDFVPLLNPTASPEKIEICGISPQSLKISWNHISSATVHGYDLEEITQVLQQASQMTQYVIRELRPVAHNFSMPPIFYQRLTTLSLDLNHSWHYPSGSTKAMLFGSLTLPCLQEFHTDEIHLLTPPYLPALVRRSSCPLTGITLRCWTNETEFADIIGNYLEPLPGVTHLVLETSGLNYRESLLMSKIEEYFPDLRHLTLQLAFFYHMSFQISELLGRNRPLPDSPNGRTTIIVLVKDQDQVDRNSAFGEELEACNISLREDGFELS